LDVLKTAGAKPFILPAMGSHGGATPEGQIEVLESYGLTEQSMGVPIRASMEVERIGVSADGVDVFCSVEAQRSDGIVLIKREKELLEEARRLMPRLPFDDIDLLIVDRIGKNISGAGMDPNVTGRWVHGYSSSLGPDNQASPLIRRIFVRDLTPETHGNAIG